MTFSRRRVTKARTANTEEQLIREFIAGKATLEDLDERDEWFSFALPLRGTPFNDAAIKVWQEVGPRALKPYKNGAALPDNLQYMVTHFGHPTTQEAKR